MNQVSFDAEQYHREFVRYQQRRFGFVDSDIDGPNIYAPYRWAFYIYPRYDAPWALKRGPSGSGHGATKIQAFLRCIADYLSNAVRGINH